MTAVTASAVGLWALDAAPEDVAPAALAAAGQAAPQASLAVPTPGALAAAPAPPLDGPVGPLPAAQPVQDPLEVVARASRSRRLEVAAAERARAAATARAAQAARTAAVRARAAQAAAREAERRSLYGTACPVPSATFIDSWGYGRSGGRAHKGTDLMARYGAPVYAVRSGVVQTSSGGNAGLSISLTDVEGDTYFYAHNSVNLVSDGERVEVGELIARVGTSGNARGGPAHVHFELQPGGGSAVRSYRFLREVC